MDSLVNIPQVIIKDQRNIETEVGLRWRFVYNVVNV